MKTQNTFFKSLQLVFSLICLTVLTTTTANANWTYSISTNGSNVNSTNVSTSNVTINGGSGSVSQSTTQQNNQSNYQNNSWQNYYKEKTPEFPYCRYPKGERVAYYREGWHWIVGNPVLQWGKDSVYAIGYGNYLQCFCPKKSDEPDYTPSYKYGVQTNWLKASNVSERKQNELKSQGWIWVANGADFGLATEPYLAKNIGYQCKTPWSKYHI